MYYQSIAQCHINKWHIYIIISYVDMNKSHVKKNTLYWVNKVARVKKNITKNAPKITSTSQNIRVTIKISPCPAPGRSFINDNDDVLIRVKNSPAGPLTPTSNITSYNLLKTKRGSNNFSRMLDVLFASILCSILKIQKKKIIIITCWSDMEYVI